MNKNHTIGKLFLERTQERPEENALGWIEDRILKHINYNTYQHLVESISLSLINNGLNKNDKVAIVLGTKIEWHLIDIAILCSRAIVVPISPDISTDDLIYILNHAEIKIVFVENNEKIKELNSHQLPFLETVISLKKISRSNDKNFPFKIHLNKGHLKIINDKINL